MPSVTFRAGELRLAALHVDLHGHIQDAPQMETARWRGPQTTNSSATCRSPVKETGETLASMRGLIRAPEALVQAGANQADKSQEGRAVWRRSSMRVGLPWRCSPPEHQGQRSVRAKWPERSPPRTRHWQQRVGVT